ncbi:hypothetical protein K2X40_02785 [Candidatus Babeliales bacterium]|nr:hypothetical protein [Candidatus Babeliales bacterium]
MNNRKTLKFSDPVTEQEDEEYQDLLLSELLIAIMKTDAASVHELAKTAGISSTIIQNIRS